MTRQPKAQHFVRALLGLERFCHVSDLTDAAFWYWEPRHRGQHIREAARVVADECGLDFDETVAVAFSRMAIARRAERRASWAGRAVPS